MLGAHAPKAPPPETPPGAETHPLQHPLLSRTLYREPALQLPSPPVIEPRLTISRYCHMLESVLHSVCNRSLCSDICD